jgi:hypothetical protein
MAPRKKPKPTDVVPPTHIQKERLSVPVSERALIQRLNRSETMREREWVVKTSRGWRAHLDLGHHYILNWRINGVVGKNIDLEEYGRNFGVLQPYEHLHEGGEQ